MKRTFLTICVALAGLGIGACERHSPDDLPGHYRNRHAPHTDAAPGKAPAHGAKDKAPDGGHKG